MLNTKYKTQQILSLLRFVRGGGCSHTVRKIWYGSCGCAPVRNTFSLRREYGTVPIESHRRLMCLLGALDA